MFGRKAQLKKKKKKLPELRRWQSLTGLWHKETKSSEQKANSPTWTIFKYAQTEQLFIKAMMHFKTFTQTSKCLHLPLNKSIPTLVIMDNDPKPNYRSFKTLDPAQSTGSAKCLTLNSYYGLLVNMYSLSFYLFKILFSLQLLCVQVIKPISLNGHTRVLTTSIHL